MAKPEEDVDYGPWLTLVGGDRPDPTTAYLEYVEARIAEEDEDLMPLLKGTELEIGSN